MNYFFPNSFNVFAIYLWDRYYLVTDQDKILRCTSTKLKYSRPEGGRKKQKGVNQLTTAVQNQQ